jgi:hypothetical protein
MQEEIKKHGLKIFKILTRSKQRTIQRIKEILIEVFIIFIAVSISVWFHNYNEERHQQEEVREFLEGLKFDLQKDIKTYNKRLELLRTDSIQYSMIARLHTHPKDTTNTKIDIGLSTITLISGNYEGFKSSGKIGLIKDKKLKNMILTYYEDDLAYLRFGFNYYTQENLNFLHDLINHSDNLDKYLVSSKIEKTAQIGAANATAISENMRMLLASAKKIVSEIENKKKE